MIHTIQYPITLDYLKADWDPWAVVREFVSNALDESGNELPHCYYLRDEALPDWVPDYIKQRHDNGNHLGDLVIANRGRSLRVSDFLLGAGDKLKADAIGKFHEGMKIALLVMTRMELSATIYSGNLVFTNRMDTLHGENVLAIDYEETDVPVHGTVVILHGWEHGDYRNYFLKFRDIDEIMFDDDGRMILNQRDPDIFVKGVWVSKATTGSGKTFRFGYNLMDVSMNRDRQAVSEYDIYRELGRIWSHVAEPELFEHFLLAIKDEQAEQFTNLRYISFHFPEAFKAAWSAIHGDNAFIESDEAWKARAIHHGAKVVKPGDSLSKTFAAAVGWDHEAVAAATQGQHVPVRHKDLSASAKAALNRVKKLMKVIDPDITVEVYLFPPGDRDADADIYDRRVRLSVKLLQPGQSNNLYKALIEEAAHILHMTSDGTFDHMHAVKDIGARLIAYLAG